MRYPLARLSLLLLPIHYLRQVIYWCRYSGNKKRLQSENEYSILHLVIRRPTGIAEKSYIFHFINSVHFSAWYFCEFSNSLALLLDIHIYHKCALFLRVLLLYGFSNCPALRFYSHTGRKNDGLPRELFLCELSNVPYFWFDIHIYHNYAFHHCVVFSRGLKGNPWTKLYAHIFHTHT